MVLPRPVPSRAPPRSFTTILAPSRANRRAWARPMPPPAPVIAATLPSRSPMEASIALANGAYLTIGCARVGDGGDDHESTYGVHGAVRGARLGSAPGGDLCAGVRRRPGAGAACALLHAVLPGHRRGARHGLPDAARDGRVARLGLLHRRRRLPGLGDVGEAGGPGAHARRAPPPL